MANRAQPKYTPHENLFVCKKKKNKKQSNKMPNNQEIHYVYSLNTWNENL